jgi:uncharacterized protein YjbJ (UPF0337 family)
MDWMAATTEWGNFKGVVRTNWGKFTESDLAEICGDRARLAMRIEECYHLTGAQAEQQIRNFEARCEYFSAVSSR